MHVLGSYIHVHAQITRKKNNLVSMDTESLSFKFHEDPFVNARARGGNARIRDITCAHAFLTRARAFMHGS